MNHAVTEDELTNYVEQKRQDWTRFASSASKDSVKTLDFCIRHIAPVYRVRWGDRDIYIGALKETAVREYNALP